MTRLSRCQLRLASPSRGSPPSDHIWEGRRGEGTDTADCAGAVPLTQDMPRIGLATRGRPRYLASKSALKLNVGQCLKFRVHPKCQNTSSMMLEPRLTLTFNLDFGRPELELFGQIWSRDVDSKFYVDSDQK
jgi:hypothetical protein